MKATKRIYHEHPVDGYAVLVAVPGQEVTADVVKADVRPEPIVKAKD